MEQEQIKAEDYRWAGYYVLTMQRYYKKEIKEAIDQLKRGISDTNIQKQQKRRKRGYWTPVGFAWFKKKNSPYQGRH